MVKSQKTVPCPLCGKKIPDKTIYPRKGTVAFCLSFTFSFGGWGQNQDEQEIMETVCNDCYMKVLYGYNQLIQSIKSLQRRRVS